MHEGYHFLSRSTCPKGELFVLVYLAYFSHHELNLLAFYFFANCLILCYHQPFFLLTQMKSRVLEEVGNEAPFPWADYQSRVFAERADFRFFYSLLPLAGLFKKGISIPSAKLIPLLTEAQASGDPQR